MVKVTKNIINWNVEGGWQVYELKELSICLCSRISFYWEWGRGGNRVLTDVAVVGHKYKMEF